MVWESLRSFSSQTMFFATLGFCQCNCSIMNSCSFAKFGLLPWQDMAGSSIQARIFQFCVCGHIHQNGPLKIKSRRCTPADCGHVDQLMGRDML